MEVDLFSFHEFAIQHHIYALLGVVDEAERRHRSGRQSHDLQQQFRLAERQPRRADAFSQSFPDIRALVARHDHKPDFIFFVL